MNIPKAIKILTELHHDETAFENDDCYHAIQLGIEALKHIREERRGFFSHRNPLLLGETKD